MGNMKQKRGEGRNEKVHLYLVGVSEVNLEILGAVVLEDIISETVT